MQTNKTKTEDHSQGSKLELQTSKHKNQTDHKRKFTDHYQKYSHCPDHPNGTPPQVAHFGGRLRVVPAPTCPLHLYLFNTGLFYSRSQPTLYTAQCPAEDRCFQGRCQRWGEGNAEWVNNSFWLISLKSVLLLGHPLQGAVPDPSRPRQGPFFHFPSLCVPRCDNTHHILFTTCEPPEGRDWLFISHPQFNKCCWMNKWTLKIQLTALVLPLTDNNWVLPKEAL